MGKLLFIRAGGTIEQKVDSEGVLRPSGDDFFHLLPNVSKNYDFDRAYLGSFDSTEMNLDMRKKIAKEIKENYCRYDGFVVTHGTDTMANTAAALSYMLQDSPKPIVLTGSQVPIYQYGTDAIRNVEDSFLVADSELGGVMIVFDSKVIWGSRASKVDANRFSAFDSAKVDVLLDVKNGIVDYSKISVFPYSKNSEMKYFIDFIPGVVYYSPMSSDSKGRVLENIIKDESVPGVVLAGYGVGNLEKKYENALDVAKELNKPVGVVSACFRGSTNMGSYEAGNWAKKKGVFELYDLTAEAAVQKMMYALGVAEVEGIDEKERVSRVREIMQTPIGWDMSVFNSRKD